MGKLNPDQPVTAVLAPNDFEAQVIAHALNAEGIRAVVEGSLNGGWAGPGNLIAPVNVLVKHSERMEALRVLRRLRAEADGLTVDDTLPIRAIDTSGRCVVCRYDMAGLDRQSVCPECGTNLADDAIAHPTPQSSIMRSSAMRLLVVMMLIGAIIVSITVAAAYFAHSYGIYPVDVIPPHWR